MRRLLGCVLAGTVATLIAGCTSESTVTSTSTADLKLIDTNGDGKPDAIDLDQDGVADLKFGAACANPIIDVNHDGIPDGIDFDCDGTADISLPSPPCTPALIDSDGDGNPDGIDLDCDGKA